MKSEEPLVYTLHYNYDEGKPETYRGAYVSCKGVIFNFNITGDPDVDLEQAVQWVKVDMKGILLTSSDVDQFLYERAEQGCFFI